MQVRVDLTAEDIERGHLMDCERCPIALAMLRALPGYTVAVGQEDVDLFPVGKSLRVATIELPLEASEFVDAFDDGADVSPFSFHVEVPDHLLVPATP